MLPGGTGATPPGVVPDPPSGGGGAVTPGNGYMPADVAVLLKSADPDAPNAVIVAPPLAQNTAPTDLTALWADTTTSPATLKYWNTASSAWLPAALSIATAYSLLTAQTTLSTSPVGTVATVTVGNSALFTVGQPVAITDNTGAQALGVISSAIIGSAVPVTILAVSASVAAASGGYAFSPYNNATLCLCGQQGIPGPQGQGFNYRGAWAASSAYYAYDVVTYGGQAYEADHAFTSGSTFNPANWNVWSAAGANGARGSLWYEGSGAPGTIAGAANNDLYLNTATGDVYQYSAGAWGIVGNIKGAAGSNGHTPQTTLTAALTTAAGSNTLTVADGAAFAVGQTVVLASGANYAHFIITVAAATTITGTLAAQTGDAATGATFAIGSSVGVAGQQGAAGANAPGTFFDQPLTGTVTGTNTAFTLPRTPVNGYAINADGARWHLGTDYTYNSATLAVTCAVAPRQWITADIC